MSEPSSKGPVAFGGAPYVDKSVTDPAAIAYAQQVEARRTGALPKYSTPTAGGPTPPIPNLHHPIPEGGPPMTMAQHAMGQRGGAPDPSAQHANYILPSDMLPPEAAADPTFMQGFGSNYATAQPHLVKKYGVIRNGVPIPAQVFNAPPPQRDGSQQQRTISDKTVADLKSLQEIRDRQQRQEDIGTDQAVSEARASSSGAAVGLGGMPGGKGGTGETAAPMTSQEIRTQINSMDEFDLDQLHEMMVRTLLNNDEQRKIVEERCDPMDLADLVIAGKVTQVVPIVPVKYEPEFESIGGDVDLALKRLIVEEAQALKVDNRYLLDKYALMGLACSLRALNKKPFPDYRDAQGNFNQDLFDVKFNKVTKLPLPLLASLGVHYFWFDIRVRKLLVAERIKNG